MQGENLPILFPYLKQIRFKALSVDMAGSVVVYFAHHCFLGTHIQRHVLEIF